MIRIILLILCSTIFANDKVFVACEGNFSAANGSIWEINSDGSESYAENPIGDTVQSVHMYNDFLFVIINGSSKINKYKVLANGLEFIDQLDTNGSGPREMVIYGDYIYFTNWYSGDIKKLHIDTFQIESSIDVVGLPEDILVHNDMIYSSITMNDDWSDGSSVVTIDPYTDVVIQTYEVGSGPGELLVHNNDVYVSRTYYDENWNSFYGTSRIDSDESVMIQNYGAGTACGGGIYSYQNSVYRVFEGGIAMLGDDLQILPGTRIGDFNPSDIYSAKVIDDYIYFGLSDYQDEDEVVVLDFSGEQIAEYVVGTLPGDFDIWRCEASLDINQDQGVDVLDIILLIDEIIGDNNLGECAKLNSDINSDESLNILDVMMFVNIILSN